MTQLGIYTAIAVGFFLIGVAVAMPIGGRRKDEVSDPPCGSASSRPGVIIARARLALAHIAQAQSIRPARLLANNAMAELDEEIKKQKSESER